MYFTTHNDAILEKEAFISSWDPSACNRLPSPFELEVEDRGTASGVNINHNYNYEHFAPKSFLNISFVRLKQ